MEINNSRWERDDAILSCPEAVKNYKTYLYFLDKFEHMYGSYTVARKSHSLFFVIISSFPRLLYCNRLFNL